jgi:hypothetical protein
MPDAISMFANANAVLDLVESMYAWRHRRSEEIGRRLIDVGRARPALNRRVRHGTTPGRQAPATGECASLEKTGVFSANFSH